MSRAYEEPLSFSNVEAAPISSKAVADAEDIQSESGLRLFALAIAIDCYVSEGIPDLSGCTNDAADFVAFLTETLGVPSERLCRLSNETCVPKKVV